LLIASYLGERGQVSAVASDKGGEP
jgi:hypothetical protein